MARTQAQIQADIDAVAATRTKILSGTLVQSFTIGDKSFTIAGGVTLSSLNDLEDRLRDELRDAKGEPNAGSVMIATFPGGANR